MRHPPVKQRAALQLLQLRFGIAVLLTVVPNVIARPVLAQRGATLVVNVADVSNGSAVADAEVFIPEIRRQARTDRSGEAVLKALPPGSYEIRVRRLGYAASAVLFAMGKDSASISMLLRPSATALDTVHVVESAITTERHRQFELRRRRGLGRFLGPETLRLESVQEFPLVAIQHFPGLAMITGRGGQWQLASRHGSCGVDTTYETLSSSGSMIRGESQGSRMVGAGSGARQTVADAATSPSSCFSDHPCHVKLFLDGQPVAETDINIVHTSELYGVEYYANGNAPPQYQLSGAACGVILLWTRAGTG